MQEKNKKFDWSYLIISIVFFVAAFLALHNPLVTLTAATVWMGLVSLLRGIWAIVGTFQLKKFFGHHSPLLIFTGIVDIIAGLLICFHFEVGFITLPLIFGIWFLADTIGDLIRAFRFKFGGGLRILNIILNIIALIAAIFIIFNPLAGGFTIVALIGFYFLSTAVSYLLFAFMGRD